MTRKMSKKSAVFKSLISLLLCFSMLVGTTFAWFTDKVSSVGNKIVAGNLDVDLELLDEETNEWRSIAESQEPLFTYENWEPGYTDVTILKVQNEGNLALKWMAQFVSEEQLSALSDVIDVYVYPSETELSYPEGRADLAGWHHVGNLTKFINTLSDTTYGYLEAGEEAYLGIGLHMQESAGNEYQGLSLGAFDIKILATQNTLEDDSFGSDYDGAANIMELFPGFDISNRTSNTQDVTISSEDGKASIHIPAGAAGEQQVSFVISEGELGSYTIDAGATDNKAVGVGNTTVQTATYDIKLLDAEGNVLSTTDDKPFTITMYVGTGLHAVPVYHEGVLISGTTYDAATGYVTFQTTSFSKYQFENVHFAYSGEYFDYSQDSVTIYNVSELNGLKGKSEYKATYNSDGAMTDSVLTLPKVGNYILYSTVKEYGAYTHLSVVVPEGSRVLLYNVSLAPLNGRDAINIVKSSATGTSARTTYILLADNTNNHLDGRYDPNRPVTGTQYGATMGTSGRSGIGFGGGYDHEYEGELVISGPKGAIYCDGAYNCPGIGGNRWDCGAFDITLKDIGFAHAYGGDNAAGIGSSQGVGNSWGNCGDIVIDIGNGRFLDAKSGGNAASVGAGGNGSCDDIYFVSGITSCWIGHYASWTSIGRCCWSSQTGSIFFEGGDVRDNRGGVDAGGSKIYFVAADEAAAKATVWKNWSGAIKSSKDNVIYGYKGKPVSLTITGLQEVYARNDTPTFTVTANHTYTSQVVTNYQMSEVDMSVGGIKTATISYTEYGKTVSTEITFKVIAPARLVAEAKQNTFNIGYGLKASDFNVKMLDSTGVAADVVNYTIHTEAVDMSTIGSKTVTFSYNDNGTIITGSCKINVANLNKMAAPKVNYWHYGQFMAGSSLQNYEAYLQLKAEWSSEKGDYFMTAYSGSYAGDYGEHAVGFNGDNHMFAQAMSGYNNLTVTNVQTYSMLGIRGNIGFNGAQIRQAGYYVDGVRSTFVAGALEALPADLYQFTGEYGTAYAIYVDPSSFAAGSTHTITYAMAFDGGLVDLCEWQITMSSEAKNEVFVDTDKPNVNVIILAGQSNAAGDSPITNEIRQKYGSIQYSNVFIHYKNYEIYGGQNYENEGFDTYQLGIGGFGSTNFGPEAGLAYTLATAEDLKDEQWYIIKFAPVGTSLHMNWLNNDKLLDTMIVYVQDAIDELDDKFDVQVRDFIWMQGEHDAYRGWDNAQAIANAYQQNEQILVTRVRTAFAKYATRIKQVNNVPGSGIAFIDAGISANPGLAPEQGGPNEWVYATIVNNAKEANCHRFFNPLGSGDLNPNGGNIPTSVYIHTDSLITKNLATDEHAEYPDDLDRVDWAHYSAASMDKLGTWFGLCVNMFDIHEAQGLY